MTEVKLHHFPVRYPCAQCVHLHGRSKTGQLGVEMVCNSPVYMSLFPWYESIRVTYKGETYYNLGTNNYQRGDPMFWDAHEDQEVIACPGFEKGESNCGEVIRQKRMWLDAFRERNYKYGKQYD